MLLAVAVAIQVVAVVAGLHRSDTLTTVEATIAHWIQAVLRIYRRKTTSSVL